MPAAALIGSAHAQGAPESTFDRVRRTKVLRIAALPGELPYFQKDLATGEWSGACIDMATDIAKVFDAKLEYLESTYGNSVLDLQSNKVDLAFALNPTPARALSIGFTHPMIIHPFGCLAKQGLDPKTWDDLNKPDIRSRRSTSARCTRRRRGAIARRRSSPATRRATKCIAGAAIGPCGRAYPGGDAGAGGGGQEPDRSARITCWAIPTVALPSCLGIQREPDTRFREVLNAWLDFNRGIGTDPRMAAGGAGEDSASAATQVPSQLSF